MVGVEKFRTVERTAKRWRPLEQPVGAGAPRLDADRVRSNLAQAFCGDAQGRPGGPPHALTVHAQARIAHAHSGERQRTPQIDRPVELDDGHGELMPQVFSAVSNCIIAWFKSDIAERTSSLFSSCRLVDTR